MYTPRHFRETRSEPLHAFMHAYPFATLVTHGDDVVAANHLPLAWVDGALHGHVARGNELASADGAEVLVIFRGPDGYVSPHWYPSKRETGREVPTWNYAVVHVHGRVRVIDERDWLLRLLPRLTDRHEAEQPNPWRISDAPVEYVERLLDAIVGVEIAVERVESKFKLSQNQPAANRAGVIAGLSQRGAPGDMGLAEWMIWQEEHRS